MKIFNSTFFFAGCSLHKPSERGLRLHVGARIGERRHRLRARSSSGSADLPLPFLFLYGQRNIVSTKALPGGGFQRKILGQMFRYSESIIFEYVANKRRAGLFYGNLHGAEGVRHEQQPNQQHGDHGMPDSACSAMQHRNDGGLTQRSHRSEAELGRTTNHTV